MKKNYEKAIELITEALVILRAEEAEAKEEPKSAKKTTPNKKSKKVEEEDEEEEAEVEETEITADDLEDMSYNDLKAYAKQLGVKAVGSHKQLLNAIKSYLENSEDEDEDEEEAVKPAKNTSKKSKKVEPEPEDEDEEDEDYEDGSDDTDEDEDFDLEDELNEMEVEELADILSEAGLSTKGKKEALVARIIKGVDDGKIELSFDDEDEEDEEEPDDDNDDADEEEADEFDVNDTENPDMPEARKKAITALVKELQASIKKKRISAKEMNEFLVSAGYTKKELKGIDDNELAELYIDSRCMFIDDEGEEVETETPYEVNGIPACCGKFLELEGDTYVCPVCGAEYEADEE